MFPVDLNNIIIYYYVARIQYIQFFIHSTTYVTDRVIERISPVTRTSTTRVNNRTLLIVYAIRFVGSRHYSLTHSYRKKPVIADLTRCRDVGKNLIRVILKR